MKAKLDCIPCLVRQTLRTLRIMNMDEKTQKKVLREILKTLYYQDWDVPPPIIAHNIHRKIRELTKIKDPYREIKMKSNYKALEIYNYAKGLIEKSNDKLLTAVKISIAGNIMDFGALENPNIEETLNKVLKMNFAINHYDTFKKYTFEKNKLLFFADNSGEIVFDKLLLETMNKLRDYPFEKVTIVVKGGPIINDATVKDIEYVDFSSIKNLEIRTISNGDPGTGPERNSETIKKWLKEHDFNIAKGQGNYEGMSELSNIFFLLIVKCNVIAKDIGARIGDIILKFHSNQL